MIFVAIFGCLSYQEIISDEFSCLFLNDLGLMNGGEFHIFSHYMGVSHKETGAKNPFHLNHLSSEDKGG